MKRNHSLILAAVTAAAAGLAWGEPATDTTAVPPADPGASPTAPDPNTMSMPSDTAQVGPSSAAPGAAAGTSANARLAAIVPSGMSAQQACSGFSSVTTCAATLHAAQNLNIPFADLKAKVASGQHLEAAIHSLKPGADAKAEQQRAEQQARTDLGTPSG